MIFTGKTLTTLEYDKIINLLVDQASSESGKERCRNLVPMVDLEEINTAEEQTAAGLGGQRLLQAHR